jgi:hypothetical protein
MPDIIRPTETYFIWLGAQRNLVAIIFTFNNIIVIDYRAVSTALSTEQIAGDCRRVTSLYSGDQGFDSQQAIMSGAGAQVPPRPRRGGIHATHKQYLGGGNSVNDWLLAGRYRYSSQHRDEKYIDKIEKTLIDKRDSSTDK